MEICQGIISDGQSTSFFIEKKKLDKYNCDNYAASLHIKTLNGGEDDIVMGCMY